MCVCEYLKRFNFVGSDKLGTQWRHHLRNQFKVHFHTRSGAEATLSCRRECHEPEQKTWYDDASNAELGGRSAAGSRTCHPGQTPRPGQSRSAGGTWGNCRTNASERLRDDERAEKRFLMFFGAIVWLDSTCQLSARGRQLRKSEWSACVVYWEQIYRDGGRERLWWPHSVWIFNLLLFGRHRFLFCSLRFHMLHDDTDRLKMESCPSVLSRL